jgi:aldehyde dehydrogenase (NAD+)
MAAKTLHNYVNGRWTEAKSGQRRSCFNPAERHSEISTVPACTPPEVEQAIEAAQAAFPAWARTQAPKRADLLRGLWEAMKARAEEFAHTITLENGKTLRESRVEVQAALKELDFQLGQGRRLGGPNVSSEVAGVTCQLRREPLGVVSLITPWNFPLNVACRKLAPALIAGNCCVLKPADLTPMSAALLFEAVHEAKLPTGVANLVFGRGSIIGDTLVTHPAIKAVSFTGSTEVGVGIATRLAARATKIQLEMGGKNPLVVLADADLELAAEAAIVGGYSCAGQWCTSTSRVIVESAVHDDFLRLLVSKAEKLKVGNGLDESVNVGPVCGAQQYETIVKYIELGKQEGAHLRTGGEALNHGSLAAGYFIAPTVFAGVKPSMRIAQEEIFGPVLSVLKAESFEEAVRLANGVVFGLASSIYTRDLGKAQRFIAESEVGLCHVNMHTAYKEPQLEFGGVKESGRGAPEAGESGVQFFTRHKAVYVKEKP